MHPSFSAFLSRTLIDRSAGHRRAVLDAFRELQQLERGEKEAIVRVQADALARLLRHAKQNTDWYAARLPEASAISPETAREALRQLPVLTRADIQSSPQALCSRGANFLNMDATGGSTGTPMRFPVDRQTQIHREASLYWSDSLAGWHYGERIAMLWGSDKDVKSALGRWKASLRWQIENRRWYNAFDMGEERMAAFHRDLTRFRPHLLVAYAGSVHTMARFLESKGLKPSYPQKAIVSSAEVTTPAMRECVERVFGVPVFDRYGNREFGAIGAECQVHQGLHLNPLDMIVEIDSPDPFREPGRILVTYLHNYAMPFLRYDTGDVGRFLSEEPCACGVLTTRLAPVSGRMSDTIRTRSGKRIHGEYFTHLLYGASEVREFQFVQETLSAYVLRVVTDGEVARDRVELWKRSMGEVLDPGDTIRVERVDQIPVLPSGKRKFTLSLVGEGGGWRDEG